MSKKEKGKKKKVILISFLVLDVILIGVGVFFLIKKTDILPYISETSNGEQNSGFHELEDGENLEDVEIQVKTSEDYVEPAEGSLDISKIQGFEAATTNSSENVIAQSEEVSASVISLSDSNLSVEAIGSYSGSFLEDGSDEPVSNVAAMLITNNSDEMLQIAEIDFQVNDSETAHFKVTNLPAKTSTLVLEENKRDYREEDSYVYGKTASGYMDEPTLEEDKFEIITEKGKITLKNKTEESYEKVYVYYKYVQLGGAYLGGITYRTPFENVAAGAEVESVASHFNPDSSKIMAVQILE